MGKLYRADLNKYKQWFKQAADQLGIDVEYKYIVSRNTEKASGESVYSELSEPIKISVIVEEGLPKIDSLKQLGWFTDTKEEQILVDFAVDTPNLQEGCRIIFSSNENKGQNKEYAIIKLTNEQLYPSCVKCLCIPILENETVNINGQLNYGQQNILADNENYTFISAEPEITIF